MKQNVGFIKTNLKELEVFILTDGFFNIGNPQPILAPDISEEAMHEMLHKLFLPESIYEAPINVMLIKKNDRIILIDTGEGYYNTENAGLLLKSLASAGFQPKEITDIIISHAHRDHIGGILDENHNFIYPNAQYYLSYEEFDFWLGENPDFSKSRNPEINCANIELISGILTSIKPYLQLFDPGDDLFDCIKTEAAPGHTPGHVVFNVYCDEMSITNLVDIIHSPLLVSQPDWGTQWDIDFEMAVQTRKKILEKCSQNRMLIMASHLPWPSIGYVCKINDQFQWMPKSHSDPFYFKL
ncbi:ribonuclease Z [Chryseobacterium nakagawai]|uniref:MBL fold metallo-hydrolase n=1 Tax=Chryseobacterium nakagawai TaxID=1241982 RepID=A0AAD1DT95_CHRNA|nr:MBL fold metallo-hydrolase [Chryseobacterium nakagawai]AZA93606.1 MBL fold metallo-hydrolase [Chryseobacterium nakagawai]VEH20306.1 ribonuclease Z [Chryseobacterium nakagawai]